MQQNVTGAYVIIMLVYRRLLTTRLHGKAAVSYQITLKKQQKLFLKGYNLEVRDVIKYMRKHRATDVTNYITCKSDVISRSRNRLSSPSVRFTPYLKEYRRTRKGMKDKRNPHGAVGKSSSEQHFLSKSAAITFIV